MKEILRYNVLITFANYSQSTPRLRWALQNEIAFPVRPERVEGYGRADAKML